MKKLGFLVLLEAQPGKENALAELLQGALALATAEKGTLTWYAVRSGTHSFAIFDTFADEAGRKAHIEGPIAKALMGRADELLALPPEIRRVEVLAAK
jgi:quinol monooxygenase YgiN